MPKARIAIQKNGNCIARPTGASGFSATIGTRNRRRIDLDQRVLSRQVVYAPQYQVVEIPSVGFEPLEKIAAGSQRRFNGTLHLASQSVIKERAAARCRLPNEQHRNLLRPITSPDSLNVCYSGQFTAFTDQATPLWLAQSGLQRFVTNDGAAPSEVFFRPCNPS